MKLSNVANTIKTNARNIVEQIARKSLKSDSPARFKDDGEYRAYKKFSANKESVLNLYNNMKNTHVKEKILKAIIECDKLKTLDTYYKNGSKISIVQIGNSNDVVNIEVSDEALSIRRRKPYKVKEMSGQFIGEEKGKFLDKNIIYLNEEEREQYKLEMVDGKFYQNKKPIVTYEAIYVMSDKGIIYSNDNYAESMFYHSSFLGGEPVACAGHIEIDNGCLTVIDNYSGHYIPKSKMLSQFAKELKDRGVDLSNVERDAYKYTMKKNNRNK